jgi:hypothetical protein
MDLDFSTAALLLFAILLIPCTCPTGLMLRIPVKTFVPTAQVPA